MNDLVPVFIVGIVFLVIYRVFELFVRRNERITIIEKLGEQNKLSDGNVKLNLPIFESSKGNRALRISLLLIGIGIGLLVGYGFEFGATGGNLGAFSDNWSFQNKISVVYFASAAIFGGIGLLTAYFIEQKHNKQSN